jgi:hypothetical protein
VIPEDETCNALDDDCNGLADDEVDCDGDSECIGVGCAEGFTPDGDDSDGVAVDDTGALVLDATVTSLHSIWVADTVGGTVSKIDTRTREEVARYRTGVYYATAGAVMYSGLAPSRTSVNAEGDVVVANRAFERRGSVTKILADGCPERGDGRVDTSTGPDDVLAWDADDDWEDDCIAWHEPVGEEGEVPIPRAVVFQDTIGLDGAFEERVWVGLFSVRRYVELDAADGSPTGREVETPGLTPYGAAIGRDGILWSAGHVSAGIGRIDTETLEYEFIEQTGGPGYCYGITVDEEGDVWCGGWASVYRVDSDEWEEVALPAEVLAESDWRGIFVTHGVASDGEGSVWFAHHGRSSFFRVDRDDPTDVTEIPAGVNVFGVGVDFDGFVWGLSYGNEGIAVVDRDTEEVETLLGSTDCAGAPCFGAIYTYSDMTGLQLQLSTGAGRWVHVFEGCDGAETSWDALEWDAETPPGTSVHVSVRTADSLPDLAGSTFSSVATLPPDDSPVDLAAAGLVAGHLLEVELLLRSDSADTTPRVVSLGVARTCGDALR